MTLPDPNVKIVPGRDAERKNLRRLVDPHDPYVDRSVFNRVIAKFGVEHQVSLIMEECSELILAISHYRRGRVKSDAIMEEVVDMTIMLEQVRLIYDPDDIEFGKIYKRKINRLEKLIEGE